MQKLESIRVNQTHTVLYDFGIKTDHPKPARIVDFELINKSKSTGYLVDFSLPADHGVKIKERGKNWKIPGPCQGAGGESDTNNNWSPWNIALEPGELIARNFESKEEQRQSWTFY